MTRERDDSSIRRVFKIYSISSFSAPQVALTRLGSLRQTHSSALATTTRRKRKRRRRKRWREERTTVC